jgi:hypothetical protein
MFPLRTGRTGISIDEQNIQQLIATSMHEILKQAVKDTALLMLHQYAADSYYRNDEGINIPTDENDKYILYTKEEEDDLKEYYKNLSLKYNILSPNGIVAQLTPFINYFKYNVPLTQDYINKLLTQRILTNMSKFNNTNIENIMNVNTDELINENDINNSYTENEISVAIYEDDTVLCNCDYCSKFLNYKYENTELNFIQEILAENYSLFTDTDI